MNKKLTNYLNTTVMKHINDVRGAFNLCANVNEVRQVIDMIPRVFGEFDIDNVDEYGFTIYNDYDEYDSTQSDEYEYAWYEAEDLKNELSAKDIKVAKSNRQEMWECGHPWDPDDFSEFMLDFEGNYNISAIKQAFSIECGNDY